MCTAPRCCNGGRCRGALHDGSCSSNPLTLTGSRSQPGPAPSPRRDGSRPAKVSQFVAGGTAAPQERDAGSHIPEAAGASSSEHGCLRRRCPFLSRPLRRCVGCSGAGVASQAPQRPSGRAGSARSRQRLVSREGQVMVGSAEGRRAGGCYALCPVQRRSQPGGGRGCRGSPAPCLLPWHLRRPFPLGPGACSGPVAVGVCWSPVCAAWSRAAPRGAAAPAA